MRHSQIKAASSVVHEYLLTDEERTDRTDKQHAEPPNDDGVGVFPETHAVGKASAAPTRHINRSSTFGTISFFSNSAMSRRC